MRHQRSPGGEPVCLREQEVPVSLVRACACPCVNVREECRPANAGSLQALDDDDDVFYLFLQEQSRSLADALMSDDVPRMRAHTPHPCLLTCLLACLLACTRIFMTSLRLGVGLLSFWTSIVIVVQAEANIDLFKDFAALQVSCAFCDVASKDSFGC